MEVTPLEGAADGGEAVPVVGGEAGSLGEISESLCFLFLL